MCFKLKRAGARILLMCLLYMVAYFAPHLSYFLNLVGGISGVALKLVLPSIIYTKYFFPTLSML